MKRYGPIAALIVIIALAPFLTSALKVPFYLTQLTMSGYYALVALGLCMLMGYAGQISLGQAGFFAIGGYTAAFITKLNFAALADSPLRQALLSLNLLVSGNDMYGQPILYPSPWIGCLAAVAIAMTVAFLIGIPVLKLRGHYLAMATLGFGVIIEKVVRGTKGLGGADGLSSVPPFMLVPGLTVSGDRPLRAMNFYIAWGLVVIGLAVLTNLINSRVGRALRSLHDGEEAADSVGIDTARYKVNVFIVGAVFAAAAGIFMTHYNGSIGPGEASIMKSVRYVSIVAVGGLANLWGTLAMGTLLNFLSLRGVFGNYDNAVFGLILILVMLFAPEGFIGKGSLRPLESLKRIVRRREKS